MKSHDISNFDDSYTESYTHFLNLSNCKKAVDNEQINAVSSVEKLFQAYTNKINSKENDKNLFNYPHSVLFGRKILKDFLSKHLKTQFEAIKKNIATKELIKMLGFILKQKL